jgi:hypothetical protein
MNKMKNAHKILVEKTEGKRLLEDKYRWEENVKMHLMETG